MSRFEELVAMAMAQFDLLTPEQQAEHRGAQRRSWVIGEMMIEHPEMTRQDAEALADKAFRALKDN